MQILLRSWTWSFHAFRPKISQQQGVLTKLRFQFHIFVTITRKSCKSPSNLHGVRGETFHSFVTFEPEINKMRKSDSPQKACDFRKMTGHTNYISSSVLNQKPDWKGTGYCFWHHYWNNFKSWWSSRGVQIWFLLNVGARKDLSRNQIPAYAVDLKCPNGWPYGSDFFPVVNPENLTSRRMRCEFGRPTIQIMPNHHQPIVVWGIWLLFRMLEPEVNKEELGFPPKIGFQDTAWLARESDFHLKFCTTNHSEKESDARIEWNYMTWMYDVIMGCVAGSVRSPFGPGPGPGLSETGHTLGFIMATQ